MKKRYILAFVLTALAGTGLHFAYDLWPVPLVGLFTPVNESVWEHLKLLYWPFLAASALLCAHRQHQAACWGGHLAALLGMPLVLLGVYYILLAGFGVQSLVVDIGLYYLTLALSFFLSCRWGKRGTLGRFAGILVILAGLYGAALILFTMAPPELPIFIENL